MVGTEIKSDVYDIDGSTSSSPPHKRQMTSLSKDIESTLFDKSYDKYGIIKVVCNVCDYKLKDDEIVEKHLDEHSVWEVDNYIKYMERRLSALKEYYKNTYGMDKRRD